MTDDGKRSGKLSINTKYLIYGDEPKGEAAVTAYGEMKSEAQTLGVHLTKVNDFLDYMGYKPEDRTVQLGKKSKSSDFKARMPDVQRMSHGLSAPRICAACRSWRGRKQSGRGWSLSHSRQPL